MRNGPYLVGALIILGLGIRTLVAGHAHGAMVWLGPAAIVAGLLLLLALLIPDDAMQAALAAGPALGADETPVSVLTSDENPGAGQPDDGFPHVLVIRPPGGDLTWLRALGSRRAAAMTAIPGLVTGSSLPAETPAGC